MVTHCRRVSYGELAVDGVVVQVAALASATRPAARAERRRVARDAVVVQVAAAEGVVLDWVLSAALLPHVRARLAR